MGIEPDFIFEPLDKGIHDRTHFDCGIQELNEYIRKYASQQQEKHLSRVYVSVNRHSKIPKIILGFYTLSTSSLSFKNFPDNMQKNIPKNYPIPTIKIGRLARNINETQRGFGGKILGDALYRALKLSGEVGAFAVDVNAKNDQAKKFYQNYGFIELQDDPLGLIIPMQTLEKSFSGPFF